MAVKEDTKDKSTDEVIDLMVRQRTLNELLARDPQTLQPDDIREIIQIEREKRAAYVQGKAAKEK